MSTRIILIDETLKCPQRHIPARFTTLIPHDFPAAKAAVSKNIIKKNKRARKSPLLQIASTGPMISKRDSKKEPIHKDAIVTKNATKKAEVKATEFKSGNLVDIDYGDEWML